MACSEPSLGVDAGEGLTFYLPSGCSGTGFEGSAVVTADGGDERVVAIANATNYGGSYAFSYNGVNR